jgi:hypothetical protein
MIGSQNLKGLTAHVNKLLKSEIRIFSLIYYVEHVRCE